MRRHRLRPPPVIRPGSTAAGSSSRAAMARSSCGPSRLASPRLPGTTASGEMLAEVAATRALPARERHGAGEDVALSGTPGPKAFRVLYPHQDRTVTGARPFFFQDATRTFFVGALGDHARPASAGATPTSRRRPHRPGARRVLQPPGVRAEGTVVRGRASTRRCSSARRPIRVSRDRAHEARRRDGRDPARGGRRPDAPRRVRRRHQASVSGAVAALLEPTLVTAHVATPAPPESGGTGSTRIYHPYVCTFIRELNRDGIDGLLQRATAARPARRHVRRRSMAPTVARSTSRYPRRGRRLLLRGAYAVYNWELFFHAPLLIAGTAEPEPAVRGGAAVVPLHLRPDRHRRRCRCPQKYWRTRPFFETTADDVPPAADREAARRARPGPPRTPSSRRRSTTGATTRSTRT